MGRTFLALAWVALAGGFAPAAAPPRVPTPAERDLQELRALLARIQTNQRRIYQEIIAFESYYAVPRAPIVPTISGVDEVAIAVGRSVVIQHRISWNQYPGDDMRVRVTSSDPSLVVPKELVLDFDKHQFKFEYEIKAGDKAGTFTVTLTPAAGKAVEVRVTVK
jgi:hypothetical protein